MQIMPVDAKPRKRQKVGQAMVQQCSMSAVRAASSFQPLWGIEA